jgi:1-acyl-sn-glycerol-3-phosphate acyltransferase
MDAPTLMAALNRPIRFACHHYMGQVPVMREIVTGQLGCFPWKFQNIGSRAFFQQALKLLQASGGRVFPEGTKPMVRFIPPNQMGEFERDLPIWRCVQLAFLAENRLYEIWQYCR